MGKVCNKCRLHLPNDEFHSKTNTPDKLDYTCKECRRAYNRARYKNPEIAAKQRASSAKSKYGVEWVEVEGMYANQSGRCALCATQVHLLTIGGSRTGVACIDHCHVTGAPRGLLCNACNVGLGRFKDNPTVLRAAALYVEQYECRK